jgi:hypothetical protein
MRGLEPPAGELWRSRNDWFWRAHDVNAGPQPLDLDARAAALLAELELLFCAGAWASVVIIGWTLVEAAQRRAARGDEVPAPDVDWLREQRNALVHIAPGIQTEMPDEAAMTALAQGAIRVVFKTLFAEAWMRPR